MRLLNRYLIVGLIFAAVCTAQSPLVLDPYPARVIGHPSASPPEQLLITNINPNFGVTGGLYSPQGIAVDTNGSAPILYVADTANNRVLAWKNATSSTLTNLQSPDLVIGQPNAYTTFPLTNGGLYYPSGLLVDSKSNLYIADSGNNRILRYPAPFTSHSTTPDIVLGQHDMFTARSGNQGGTPSQTTLCFYQACPTGSGPFVAAMAMDSAGDLFVTDSGNNRVLRYPAASLTAGAVDPAADLVIGQSSFTQVVSGFPNPLDKNVLYNPAGLAFDAEGRLFVTDNANRIVVFPSSVTGSGAANFPVAIRIAGYVTPAPSTATASTLSSPSGIVMINDGPAVLDTNNNRMLIFDSYSSQDWALASGDTTLANPPPVAIAVLGQGTALNAFTSNSANAGNTQAVVSGTDVPTFYGPVAAAVSGNDLFVLDSNNNRVLAYPSAGTTANATHVLGQSDFPYNSPNSIQGKEFYFASGFGSSADAGIAIDSGSSTPHLYVSDPNNHRVLGFADARLIAPGVPADIVIGEPDLHTAVCNFGGVANPSNESLPRQPTQASLCYPTGLAVDAGGNLYVADSENGRVLRFPAPFDAANSSRKADLVLGQTGFTGVSNPKASQTVMIFPYGLLYDPARGLLVSDWSANRVLLFPLDNPSNGEAASKVIGQSNFTATGNTLLSVPHHIAEDSIGQVYIADTGHNQIQIFAIPSGSSTDQPLPFPFTGLSSPEAVWVNPHSVAGYHDDIWVGDASGLTRYPVPNPIGTGTPTLRIPVAEIQGGESLDCPGTGVCGYPAVAITQDAWGNLYVADTSNRVSVHYAALRATNGGSYACGMGCALPGSIESFNQSFLAPGVLAALFPVPVSNTWQPFTSNPVLNSVLPIPTTLGGVQVLVNGHASPLVFVGTGQINLVVPFEEPVSGTAQLVVVNSTTGQVLGSGAMTMNAAAPGFFTANQSGTGQIAALNCNKTPCENTKNSSTAPANQGSVLQLYLTGQGQVPNAPPDGQASTGTVSTPSTPAVYVGGTLAKVDYSGLAPGYPGLWQINIEIPKNPIALPGFPTGVYPVLVNYNGLASNTPTNNRDPAVATTIFLNAP